MDIVTKLEKENAALRHELAEANRKLAITELKASGSLANNLCSDHRDKQQGKPCLACTIETLNRKLAGREGYCEWYLDVEDDFYGTGCGQAFSITEGTPAENHMKYCHFCGKTICLVAARPQGDV